MNNLAISEEVASAIDDLEAAFPGRVETVEHDSNGAIVRINECELSDRWSHQIGVLWFLIPYHYPDAAIYPYYVTGSTPTGELITGLQPVNWREAPATQISLRHNAWNPKIETALGSVLQTMEWLRSQ